jgi:hypothetical protein
MAKEKRQTGALDVSAMYQIGAGSASTKKTSDKTSVIGQIGRYALGYYMKASDNLRDSRRADEKLFATLEVQALDADVVLPQIEGFKKQLDESNKVLNSVRGMLLPDSDMMKKAQEDRAKVMRSIMNARSQYIGFKPIKEYQMQVASGKYIIGKDTEKEDTVGYAEGNTALQMYNSSLLVNGSLEKALSLDWDGNLIVNVSAVDKPFFDKEGKSSWDNPRTSKIETKADFKEAYKDVTTMKLKDMDFATHANPNQANHAENHLMTLSDLGNSGKYQDDDTIKHFKGNLGKKLDGMMKTPRNMVNYLFQKDTWVGDDGDPTSLVEALMNQDLSGFSIEADSAITLARIDDPKTKDIDESEITTEEMAGIKEIIKNNVLDGKYSTEALRDMIHNKAEKTYRDNYEAFEKRAEDSIQLSVAEKEYRNRERLYNNDMRAIKNHKDITVSASGDKNSRSYGYVRKLEWFDGTGKGSKGWHILYQKDDGKWYFEGKPTKSDFENDEAAERYFNFLHGKNK